MKTKRLNANKFEKAQYKLYTYIDWLYNSGRLTVEEHSKLVDATAECVLSALSFGYNQSKGSQDVVDNAG